MSDENRPYNRRVLIVNPEIQYTIIIFAYLSALLGGVFALAIVTLAQNAAETGFSSQLSTVSMFGVLTMIGIGVSGLYLTNRICGPLYKLQKYVKEKLEEVEPEAEDYILTPRDGDYYGDLTRDVGALLSIASKNVKPK